MKLLTNMKKWVQVIKTSWTRILTYRIDFLLQIIGPTLVFFFIKYNLWSAIYHGNQEVLIKGYNFSDMIRYHVWGMIVILLTQGNTAHNLSEEIRMGKISSYLVYPFNFWEFHTAHFIAFQFLQISITLMTIICIALFSTLGIPPVKYLLAGYAFSLFVSLFWFLIQYSTGLISFWLEETWALRVILKIVATFLSGAIIPLDLYPPWLFKLLQFTPFPYLTYYPIKIFTGEITHLYSAYFTISLWILLFMLINHIIWKRGLKEYTAAGM